MHGVRCWLRIWLMKNSVEQMHFIVFIKKVAKFFVQIPHIKYSTYVQNHLTWHEGHIYLRFLKEVLFWYITFVIKWQDSLFRVWQRQYNIYFKEHFVYILPTYTMWEKTKSKFSFIQNDKVTIVTDIFGLFLRGRWQ